MAVIAAIFIFGSCSKTMDYSIKDKKKRVKSYLESAVKKEFPGIQYLVVNKTGIIFEFNGGWKDIKNDEPVERDTVFMLNSSTKTITAIGVLQLCHKKSISVEDPLSKYFMEHPYGDGVKIKHLIVMIQFDFLDWHH